MLRNHSTIIVNTRPDGRAAELTELLRLEGATVVECPALEFQATDYGIEQLKADYDADATLVFTSVNGVQFFTKLWDQVKKASQPPKRIWAVGPATAKALIEVGMHADVVAPEATGTSLADAAIELKDSLPNCRVIMFRGIPANESLPAGLRAAGFELKDIAVYRTMPAANLQDEVEALAAKFAGKGHTPPIWVFSSPEGMRQVVEAWNKLPQDLAGQSRPVEDWAAVAIGSTTEQALNEIGMRNVVKAKATTGQALLEAVLQSSRET